MKNLLFVSFVALLFLGCGKPAVPVAKKDVTKRPSMIYQPNRYAKLNMKYPLNVGVLQFTDARVRPFYGKQNFFQQEDMNGLTQMTYLELKNSNLFGHVKLINEKPPFELNQDFFYKIMDKYGVDVIFIGDVTSFALTRKWTSAGGTTHGTAAFETAVDLGLIGQLIYLDGGVPIWNGKVSRKNKLLVKQGKVSSTQLTSLVHETQQQMFSDLMKHIDKNGKRMMVQ